MTASPALPVPQFLSLNGSAWRFRDASGGRWRPAQVPGCVHADLRRAGAIPDPFVGRNEFAVEWIAERDWVYATEFTVSAALRAHEHLDLVAEGLDTVAHVFLNGVELGASDNMFVAHRWSARTHLRRGRNRLEIRFASPEQYLRTHRREHVPREINDPVGGCTRLRKQQCSFGWDWGPRLPTSGIWRPIGLHAWSGNRLVDVRLTQTHRRDGSVQLAFAPELVRKDARVTLAGTVTLDGRAIAKISNLKSEIPNPLLWWPSGQGAQPLYTVALEVRAGSGRVIDTWTRRIGLRTIELDRHADQWGESFQFKVNGRAIFAKGANWIPAHALTAGLGRADYAALLQAMVDSNMNMIRVWGGGIYEHEAFYDLCDELGLLVWQDFMFACTLYPGDPAFLRSVRREAQQQVARLRHRACLALWCGNNEIESLNGEALRSPRTKRDYDALFRQLLPAAVAAGDGVTPYWESSPFGAQNLGTPKDGAKLTGDWHDWDVWHARHPVKAYEKSHARFVSEFGMQSFASETVARGFCPPDELNIFSPTMEARQKNPSGNMIMADYIARRYRFAGGYASLAYLSQLNQAYCMKVAVEHWRRSQPRTMGALYWQLNDCWPSISWSSIEFGGRWKPLQHAARRFFAPVLLSAYVHGDEARGIGNRLQSDVHRVDLFTVSDHPTPVAAAFTWELWLWPEGRVLRAGKGRARLQPGEARRRVRLDFTREIARHGREQLLLRLRIEPTGRPPAEDVVLFTAPRHLALRDDPIEFRARAAGPGRWLVKLRSRTYHHGVVLDLPRANPRWSDNAFDLLPDVTREIEVSDAGVTTAAQLERAVRIRSLVHSYTVKPAAAS